MNKAVIEKRPIEHIGLGLYFYNIRTLAIFEFEVLYQLTEGIWSSSRYPEGHSEPWVMSNLFLTSGKSNVRNVVEPGCNIIKNDYNLKKILNIPTSYNRVKCIGRLSNALEDDKETLMTLLNGGFHEYSEVYPEEFSDDLYNQAMLDLSNFGASSEMMMSLSPDIMEKYCSSVYTDDEIRDDLGMIQNTMRNITSFQY